MQSVLQGVLLVLGFPGNEIDYGLPRRILTQTLGRTIYSPTLDK